MESNKEVKIAIIVGIIMITICLVIFIFYRAEANVETLNLKVYKLYDIEGTEDEHEYRECSATADEIVMLSKEYKRTQNLTENKQVTGKQINGNYKVIYEDEYIAFDAEGINYIYRSDTERLYSFNSKIYDYVTEICK